MGKSLSQQLQQYLFPHEKGGVRKVGEGCGMGGEEGGSIRGQL